MIKALIISTIGVGIFGAGVSTQTVKELTPNSIGLTAGPVEFRAGLCGMSTGSSEQSELALTIYSKSGQLINVKF